MTQIFHSDGINISIHAAREGGDFENLCAIQCTESISIHAAREGGDPATEKQKNMITAFQSTPPVKAATTDFTPATGVFEISIHAAREGGDVTQTALTGHSPVISIHAAREGGDSVLHCKLHLVYDFNPRRP